MTLATYCDEVQTKLATGMAAEHAYRHAVEDLLKGLEESLEPVNDPKRFGGDAPDFVVMRGQVPIGFIETKDLDANLNRVEKSEQLKRYRGALGNLILTNYVEFRWYVEGEHRETATLGTASKGKLKRDREGMEAVTRLLQGFFAEQTPTIGTPRELAERMAAITRMVRFLIERTFASEEPSETLHAQLEAFRKTIIPNLKPEQFADMYAQTIAYGLFAARARWDGRNGTFDRRTAEWHIPRTNPFLRGLFREIAGLDLDERVAWLVDSLADLLARADMAEILKDYGKATRQEDPVVHFYETFLAAYDPAMREQRGVYYTPEPVVSYIVRSVDWLLKERLGRPDGLADKNTLILDPAAGTGTFLYFVIQHIHAALDKLGQLGAWDGYVRDSMLPRLFGFELLMAPYAMAHMKLGIQLQNTGYDIENSERLFIYLTNTLTDPKRRTEVQAFAKFLSEESAEAAEVKRTRPIMVVLGNPPYSGHSANTGDWINNLLKKDSHDFFDGNEWLEGGLLLPSYFKVDGGPLGERNPKWLQDDYVKFIRFGQWRIAQTGEGILAFVTNHSYLDNPTFRGMRQSLMNTFSEIFILDLHGNSLKKEVNSNGGPDENVFDIQQGVAIGIMVKRRDASEGIADVHYVDLWGTRDQKYSTLRANAVETTEWLRLEPDSPQYLFVPQDTSLRDEYQRWWLLTDAFRINSVGIVTGQDKNTIAFEESEAHALAEAFGLKNETVRQILYRPFDIRYIVYDDSVIARSRQRVMRHMLRGKNLGLIATRQTRDEWCVSATNILIGHKSMAAYDINTILPLYVFPNDGGRDANIEASFMRDLEDALGLTFVADGRGDLESTVGPEAVLEYAYSIFHCPSYRARYAEFLRRDYPRLPLTKNRKLFSKLAKKGADLVELHLLEGQTVHKLVTTFPIKDGNSVERGYPKYSKPSKQAPGRVHINKTQYFEGIDPDVWALQIGGYQVLDKWLKDRRGRTLSWDDIQHYQRVVVALKETMRLMEEIDEIIPGWPLE